MKRPSVKLALIGAISGLCVLIAFLGYISISVVNAIDDAADDIAYKQLPSISLSKEIDTSLSDLQLAYANHIIATESAEIAAADKVIVARKQDLQRKLKDYQALIDPNEAGERTLYQTVAASNEEITRLGDEVAKLSRLNLNVEAKSLYDTRFTPVADKMGGAVNALVKINADAIALTTRESELTTDRGRYLVFAVGGGAMGLGLLAILFAITGIANPILHITASMRKLAEGDTATAIPFSDRSDEIGTMAAAVEVFRQAALSNKRLEEEAETARLQAERDRIADHQRAETDAAERLRVATSGLAIGLKRLADGDLAFQLTEAFAPDFEALRHDFNKSVRQLGETLQAITGSIGMMDSGTREISAGANDLSRRTEQQAAALEETAAALEEITANVSSSAKRTEETRSLAAKANANAVNSSIVVTQAEEAMRRIETSSQQISNIIGVIDEIAFQTNLLALNAGVEAARAGEAGKGFAVVAQEVRELAQRSAKAAKEIKELIRNSAVEVDGGVKLVRDTGMALGTICGFIAEINQHVDAISVSAREQSTGLAEVNSAVNSMDQTTQQNAAMVEQSTAASSSLALEAEKLRELVAVFRLEGGAATQASLLRKTAVVMAAPVRSTPAPASAYRPAARAAASGRAAGAAGDWEEF